jgi:hypothetical protein
MELNTVFKRETAAGLILIESKKLIILLQNRLMARPLFRAEFLNRAEQATIQTESVGLKMAV